MYIMYMMVTPAVYHSEYVQGDKFYNWTITVSSRWDMFFPYFELLQTYAVQPEFTLPQMVQKRPPHKAMVAWILSHCHTVSKKERYVLRWSIAIDIYGRCGNSCHHNGTSCIKTLARRGQYKFYLAFENSACKGYITEKSLLPLKSGLVPVVYGGWSSEDYVRMLPPHSFINVRKFKSPRQLAQYLIYLDHNHTAYRAYFAWRKSYITTHGNMCRVCQALHSKSMMRPRNINCSKFWNSSTMCDADCFVCGISLTSGQLVSELFPDCTRSCFSQVVLRRRGGDPIYEMRCLFVAVGPDAPFIVLPHWDNMS